MRSASASLSALQRFARPGGVFGQLGSRLGHQRPGLALGILNGRGLFLAPAAAGLFLLVVHLASRLAQGGFVFGGLASGGLQARFRRAARAFGQLEPFPQHFFKRAEKDQLQVKVQQDQQ